MDAPASPGEMSAVDFPCSSTDAGDNQYDFELDELADQPQSSDINFNAFDDHETLEQTVKAPNAFLQRIMAKKPASSSKINLKSVGQFLCVSPESPRPRESQQHPCIFDRNKRTRSLRISLRSLSR